MIHKFIITTLFAIIIKAVALISSPTFADRLKDLTSIAGVRSNQLVGYGIVVGLAGTGDGNIGLTLQSMQSMVSRFGLATDVKGLDGKILRQLWLLESWELSVNLVKILT